MTHHGKIFYLTSVELAPTDLKYVPQDLINDEDIVFTALTNIQNTNNVEEIFNLIHSKYKNDKNFVLKVLKTNPKLCGSFTEFLNDRDIIMTCIESGYPTALDDASDDIKSDKIFVIKAMKCNVATFFHASYNLKNDKELALLAIGISPKEGLNTISIELFQDLDVLYSAFKKNAIALDESLRFNQNLYQSFEKILQKKSEKDFVEALKNIDYTNHPTLSPMSPSVMSARMIDNILNKISLKILEKTTIKNDFLNKKVFQSIQEKRIKDVDLLNTPKKKNRKLVY